jgi:hypothetical protein
VHAKQGRRKKHQAAHEKPGEGDLPWTHEAQKLGTYLEGAEEQHGEDHEAPGFDYIIHWKISKTGKGSMTLKNSDGVTAHSSGKGP